MFNPKFELLVKKGNNVHYVVSDTNEKMERWLEKYQQLHIPALLINRENRRGKATDKTDWSKYAKTVKVTFGDRRTYTYITHYMWEIGDARWIKTRRGKSWGVVCSEPKYMSVFEIQEIEDSIGYGLICLEEAVIE